jgi:hypothetical protein
MDRWKSVYLVLAFKEQAPELLEQSIEELVLEVEVLQEQNGFFNTSSCSFGFLK